MIYHMTVSAPCHAVTLADACTMPLLCHTLSLQLQCASCLLRCCPTVEVAPQQPANGRDLCQPALLCSRCCSSSPRCRFPAAAVCQAGQLSLAGQPHTLTRHGRCCAATTVIRLPAVSVLITPCAVCTAAAYCQCQCLHLHCCNYRLIGFSAVAANATLPNHHQPLCATSHTHPEAAAATAALSAKRCNMVTGVHLHRGAVHYAHLQLSSSSASSLLNSVLCWLSSVLVVQVHKLPA